MWLHTGNASIASVLAALFSTSLALAQPTLIDQLDDLLIKIASANSATRA